MLLNPTRLHQQQTSNLLRLLRLNQVMQKDHLSHSLIKLHWVSIQESEILLMLHIRMWKLLKLQLTLQAKRNRYRSLRQIMSTFSWLKITYPPPQNQKLTNFSWWIHYHSHQKQFINNSCLKALLEEEMLKVLGLKL